MYILYNIETAQNIENKNLLNSIIIASTMDADDLLRKGARASAGMILT